MLNLPETNHRVTVKPSILSTNGVNIIFEEMKLGQYRYVSLHYNIMVLLRYHQPSFLLL